MSKIDQRRKEILDFLSRYRKLIERDDMWHMQEHMGMLINELQRISRGLERDIEREVRKEWRNNEIDPFDEIKF